MLGDFINLLPNPVFVLIHLALFLAGVFFASRTFQAGFRTAGWAFVLYVLAELSYMAYHVDLTVILFSHTLAEIFNVLAFFILFSAMLSYAMAPRPR